MRPDAKPALDFVDFSLKRPKAKRVELVGDFNGWNDKALPMMRGEDGSWQVAVPLPPNPPESLRAVLTGKDAIAEDDEAPVVAAGGGCGPG